MMMTVLPPRCAFSRRRTTRPNLEGFGVSEDCADDLISGPAGKPADSRAANGFCKPAPVGVRSSFGFLDMREIVSEHSCVRKSQIKYPSTQTPKYPKKSEARILKYL